MFNTFRLQVRQLSSRTYHLCWHVDFNECFAHIPKIWASAPTFHQGNSNTGSGCCEIHIRQTSNLGRLSPGCLDCVLAQLRHILCNCYIFFNCCPSKKNKTILINDSSCRGHFWLYAHVHLDNKILSLVIHAGMKVTACALQISAMVAAFITLLNHHGKPFTVYINYLRLSFNKLINLF